MKRKILDVIRLIWKINILEKVLIKFTIGKIFGTLITKISPNYYQYKKGSIRLVNRDGINYNLDISDIIDWFIYFGFKENSRINLYFLINENDVIIDAGANIGDVSLHASKMVGSKGRVYSFEPDSDNFNRLQKNISLNTFSNIESINKGLGDNKGLFNLFQVNKNNRGMNRILFDTNIECPYTVIEVTTIDNFIIENNISKIDLIKIDVEGYEMKVLKGSESTINKFHPKLFIEIDDNNLQKQNNSSKELINFLVNKGYVLSFADNGKLIPRNFNFDNCHFDIIGIMNPKMA